MQPLWNVVEGRAVSAVVGLSGGVNWVRLCGCVSEGWGCGIEVSGMMLDWRMWFLDEVCGMDWCPI